MNRDGIQKPPKSNNSQIAKFPKRDIPQFISDKPVRLRVCQSNQETRFLTSSIRTNARSAINIEEAIFVQGLIFSFVVTSFYKMVGKRKDRQTDAFEIRYHRATLIDVLINQRPGVTSTRRSRQRRLTYRGVRGWPKAQSRDNFSTGSKLTGRAILREPLLLPRVTNSRL